MYTSVANRNDIALTCFTVLVLFFIIGLSACASIPEQPTTINCPEVDTSSLQCVVTGTWQGTAMNAAEVYGEFEITISPNGTITGRYFGPASGDIAGCIDTGGNIQASGIGSGGKITWLGNVNKTKENLFIGGTWELASGKGTWSGKK